MCRIDSETGQIPIKTSKRHWFLVLSNHFSNLATFSVAIASWLRDGFRNE